MIEFELIEEHKMLREEMRDFTNGDVNPMARRIDEETRIPPVLKEEVHSSVGRREYDRSVPVERDSCQLRSVLAPSERELLKEGSPEFSFRRSLPVE